MLILKNIVGETYTNASGCSLYYALLPYFNNNEVVTLSFKDSGMTSSSFLNSSFGKLIEEFGIGRLKTTVIPSNLTKTQSEMLKKYVSSVKISSVS